MTNLRRAALLAMPVLLAAAAPAAADLDVSVRGVEGPERENIEARLTILAYANEGGDDEAEVRRLHRRAEGDIRNALEAYGYYGPTVRGRLTGAKKDWEAVYDVELGEPTRLGDVVVEVTGEGREFPAIANTLADHTLRSGARLQHAAYDGVKTALARAAYDNGFLDARFTTHQLRVDPEQHRADIELSLETGPRYFFGAVTIEQEGLEPQFVRRYVPIREGEAFEPARLLETQFALTDLGYFGMVEIQPHRERAVDRRVPITIVATPRPPRRYDVSVGYGTDTGARFGLGAEFRRLTQRGHRVRTDLRVSEIKNSISADYRIPLGTQAGENFGIATGYTDEKVGDGFSRAYDLALTLSRVPGDWQRQLYLKHRYEQSQTADLEGVQSVRLLMPGMTLIRGELDDAIHARYGWSLFTDVHGCLEGYICDVTFLQGRALLRGVLPLGARARLLLRTEQGATLVEDFIELPASQRFFAGGDQSVRGYSYQSLGPVDAEGDVIGGKYLSTYSVEAEVRIAGNWGAAVFADTGGVGDGPSPSLSTGVGAGVRYRAPVGTLQFDLAHPLDGDEGGVRPHIGIRVGL
jgi:translocation and assembly module TamA